MPRPAAMPILLVLLLLAAGYGVYSWLQTLTLILPSRHNISFGQEIIYKGAGLSVVWPAFAAVTLLGLALLAGSLILFRRSIATDR